REHHRESGVEEDPLHDDVEADQVLHELRSAFGGRGAETQVHEIGCEPHIELVLAGDRVDITVHGKDLTSVEAETLHDVMEAVCVDRLLARLAEKTLSTLPTSHMSEHRQDDVVGALTLSGRKESEIERAESALVVLTIVAAALCVVPVLRNFLRQPVIPVS